LSWTSLRDLSEEEGPNPPKSKDLPSTGDHCLTSLLFVARQVNVKKAIFLDTIQLEMAQRNQNKCAVFSFTLSLFYPFCLRPKQDL